MHIFPLVSFRGLIFDSIVPSFLRQEVFMQQNTKFERIKILTSFIENKTDFRLLYSLCLSTFVCIILNRRLSFNIKSYSAHSHSSGAEGQGCIIWVWGIGEPRGRWRGHLSCHSGCTPPCPPSPDQTHTPPFSRPLYGNWALTSNRLH